jgi:hypothetical protein
MSQSFIIALLLGLMAPLLTPSAAWGQADGGTDVSGSKALYELGFDLGNLLPNQIDGVSQIMGLGEVRGGVRFAPMSYVEGGLIMGNGNGVQWKNLHVDARMDIPVDNLVGFAYLGVDSTYYRGDNANSHLIFGGHAGGGVQIAIAGDVWIRGDMKFGLSPGNSLYIGLGFVFRFGG